MQCLTVMVNRNVEMFLHLSTTARRAVGNDDKAQNSELKKLCLVNTFNMYSVLERAVSEIKMLITHQFV
jgi:hypothetical protein